MRIDNRTHDQLRPTHIHSQYLLHPEGSVLIESGRTKVICTASVEDRVPPFLRNTGKGWVTAEYGMLPRATSTRTTREASAGKVGGRTQEIQRLIGRSLRSVMKLVLALAHMRDKGIFTEIPVQDYVAATSVGIIDNTRMLDLAYEEDSRAEVDMNVVMTGSGKFIEVQGTAEALPFGRDALDALLDLAQQGIGNLIELQKQAVGHILGR